MSGPVNLFVFLELLLYLFVGFPLGLLLISLVFSLTIAQTTHLPKNPVTGSGGGRLLGGVGGCAGGEKEGTRTEGGQARRNEGRREGGF